MKITHYRDKTTTEISSDWRDWLETAGYNRPPKFFNDGTPTLCLIESKNEDAWAFYHPPIGNLNTEYICIGIPTEAEAENLLDLAAQMIQGPLSLLSAATEALGQENHSA